MSVARAYADFAQHPPQMRTRLDVAGFEVHDYPVKRTSDTSGREKIASWVSPRTSPRSSG